MLSRINIDFSMQFSEENKKMKQPSARNLFVVSLPKDEKILRTRLNLK